MPDVVMGELAIFGLSEPAGGPASAGVAPPEHVSERLPKTQVRARRSVWTRLPATGRCWMKKRGVLPAELAREATGEEVTMMKDWGARDVIAKEGAWELTGRSPLQGCLGWYATMGAAAPMAYDAAGRPRRLVTRTAASSLRRPLRLRPCKCLFQRQRVAPSAARRPVRRPHRRSA